MSVAQGERGRPVTPRLVAWSLLTSLPLVQPVKPLTTSVLTHIKEFADILTWRRRQRKAWLKWSRQLSPQGIFYTSNQDSDLRLPQRLMSFDIEWINEEMKRSVWHLLEAQTASWGGRSHSGNRFWLIECRLIYCMKETRQIRSFSSHLVSPDIITSGPPPWTRSVLNNQETHNNDNS